MTANSRGEALQLTYPQPSPTGASWPKISIVTPSFNQAAFLEATIQSVLSQKYPNLEYVVIDGGSNDGSVEILRQYSSHLHYWCSEPDDGQYDAINKGFRHCTGEIMAWLNSDDMHFPWALRTIGNLMSSLPDVEWVTTLQPGGWDADGFPTRTFNFAGISRDAFLDGMFLPPTQGCLGWIQQESTFWRRVLWDRVGGAVPTHMDFAGDFALWSAFFKHSSPVGIPCPIAGFRSQRLQKTRDIAQYTKEAMSVLASLRKELNWRKPIARQSIRLLRLHEIPLARKILREMVGYSSTLADRVWNDGLPPDWRLTTTRFI